MKKVLLTLFAATAVFAASAQMKAGVKLGYNIASSKTEVGSASDSEGASGFHIGGYANFGLTDAISIQPELLFNNFKTSDTDVTANYISVPVMFLYTIAEKFNVQAGPQLGFLMSTDPSEVKDGTKATDFTLNIGAGANFGKFNATLRYGIGLSNNYDGPGDVTSKLSNFQISVGYQLFGE